MSLDVASFLSMVTKLCEKVGIGGIGVAAVSARNVQGLESHNCNAWDQQLIGELVSSMAVATARVTSAVFVKNGFVILQGRHIPPFFCVLVNFFIIS